MTKEQYEYLRLFKNAVAEKSPISTVDLLTIIVAVLITLVDIALKEYERKLP